MSNTDKAFYLIKQDGEYRLTGFITTTARDNHVRQGWTIVQRWAEQPTRDAVNSARFLDGVVSA